MENAYPKHRLRARLAPSKSEELCFCCCTSEILKDPMSFLTEVLYHTPSIACCVVALISHKGAPSGSRSVAGHLMSVVRVGVGLVQNGNRAERHAQLLNMA